MLLRIVVHRWRFRVRIHRRIARSFTPFQGQSDPRVLAISPHLIIHIHLWWRYLPPPIVILLVSRSQGHAKASNLGIQASRGLNCPTNVILPQLV
jgi:hypothetical protein